MSTQGDKLKAIADAIRAKEGSSDPIVANDFPARIAAIETGTQLPTLTNPGTAADLASGKQLIDQNGEIVTGTVLVRTGYTPQTDWNPVSTLPGYALCATELDQDTLLRVGTMGVNVPLSKFGDATATDVATGKTFTSEAGVKVTGTGQFLKVGLYQFTGYGSANTGIPSYPSNNYPSAIFIAMNNAIPYTNNTVFQMSVVNQAGCISGTNFVRYDEVYYGAYTSDKISLVLDHDAMQLLIYPPKSSSSEFITFENGKPYSIYYFYT